MVMAGLRTRMIGIGVRFVTVVVLIVTVRRRSPCRNCRDALMATLCGASARTIEAAHQHHQCRNGADELTEQQRNHICMLSTVFCAVNANPPLEEHHNYHSGWSHS